MRRLAEAEPRRVNRGLLPVRMQQRRLLCDVVVTRENLQMCGHSLQARCCLFKVCKDWIDDMPLAPNRKLLTGL